MSLNLGQHPRKGRFIDLSVRRAWRGRHLRLLAGLCRPGVVTQRRTAERWQEPARVSEIAGVFKLQAFIASYRSSVASTPWRFKP